jgi:hypothetical protein
MSVNTLEKAKSFKQKTGNQPAVAAPSSRKSDEQLAFEMKDFSWQWVEVTLIGETPLLTNAFSDKKLDAIQAALVNPQPKQSKRATKKARDIDAEFRQACHICKGGYGKHFSQSLFGLPSIGLKKAFARGAHEFAGAVMKDMIRFTYFHGEYGGLIPIHAVGNPNKGIVPVVQRDAVPNNQGQCTLVYRPNFFPWSATVQIRFCDSKLSLENVLNILRAAGQICGVGSFRHENGGIHGLWQVDSKVTALAKNYKQAVTPVLLKD